MINDLHSSKTLIVGTGSGRDIAACILMREYLREICQSVDVAGFLTPWALHSFNDEIEKPVNLPSEKCTKFILDKDANPIGGFFEPLFSKWNYEFDLGIDSVFLFSLQYGTYTLAERLRRLVETRAYDTIIAVDVGGDILADKNDFETLLTPMVDLACLDIIGEMPDWISAYLAVVVPGVCGEVPRERIDDIIAESRKNHSLIDVIDFNEYSPYYKKYEMLNREINHRTGSYSHTEWMIKGIVQQKPASDIKAVYEKRYQIGQREWHIRFPVEIGKDYFNRIYFFDLKHFKSHRSHIKMRYHTVIDGFMKSRLMGTCGTEVDLSFVALQFEKEEMKMPVFLLTPCCHTDAVQRRDIINYGLREVTEGSIDRVLIYAEDRSLITGNVRAYSLELGEDFLLLSRNSEPNQVIDALRYSHVNSKEVFCSA